MLHDALGQENLEYAVQLCPRGKDVSEFVLEAARENHASYVVIGLGSLLTLRRYEYRS